MICGLAVWVGAAPLWPDLPSDMLGLGASAVAMIAVTLATQKADPPALLRDNDGEVVPLRDRLGILKPFGGRPGSTPGDSAPQER